MGVLTNFGVTAVHHYSPLHYLVFIARAKSLLCKPSLRRAGFPAAHFRSKSNNQDIARGFGDYAHLTLDERPRILMAKLAAGFPHLAFAVPANAVEGVQYNLCRFNVAMTRYLKRDNKPGYPESPSNGRYYGQHQIPIARTDADKAAMLAAHRDKNTMIEVLIRGDLPLPDDTSIICFSRSDAEIAANVLTALRTPWPVLQVASPGPYPRRQSYVRDVSTFIDNALSNPNWRGNGLEFDRV